MNDVRMRIPIEITVTVGGVQSEADVVLTNGAGAGAGAGVEERFNLDEDYASRKGYDAKFLGRQTRVPMPVLTADAMELVSRDPDAANGTAHILHYHHFSIVMNKERRILFFAAYNTTRKEGLFGTKSRGELSGKRDTWILDPRIPARHQVTTSEFYKGSGFDRGHIVRREDAYWGETDLDAEYANFDTFHYTNCTPQHPGYNQSGQEGLWGLLENHIAEEALEKDMKLSVFAGPVLSENDPVQDDVKIPRRFWKIVIGRRKAGGAIGAWAFMLSQAKLIRESREESTREFEPKEFQTYQVSLRRIQELTDVRFDKLVIKADRFKKEEEAGTPDRRITSLSDIVI